MVAHRAPPQLARANETAFACTHGTPASRRSFLSSSSPLLATLAARARRREGDNGSGVWEPLSGVYGGWTRRGSTRCNSWKGLFRFRFRFEFSFRAGRVCVCVFDSMDTDSRDSSGFSGTMLRLSTVFKDSWRVSLSISLCISIRLVSCSRFNALLWVMCPVFGGSQWRE